MLQRIVVKDGRVLVGLSPLLILDVELVEQGLVVLVDALEDLG